MFRKVKVYFKYLFYKINIKMHYEMDDLKSNKSWGKEKFH